MRLPKVLYHTIYSHLTMRDLSNLKMVSKRHNELVEEFLNKSFAEIKGKTVPRFDKFLKKIAKYYDQLKKSKKPQQSIAPHTKTLKQITEVMKSLGNLLKKDILGTEYYMYSLYNRLFSDQMIAAIKDKDYTKFKFLIWQASYIGSKPHIKNVIIDVNALFKHCWVNDIPNSQLDTDKNKNSDIDSNNDSKDVDSDKFFCTSFEFDFSDWIFSNVKFKFNKVDFEDQIDRYDQIDQYNGMFLGFKDTNWHGAIFEDVHFDDVISLSDELNWKLQRKPTIYNLGSIDFIACGTMIEEIESLYEKIRDVTWDLTKANVKIKKLETSNKKLSEKNLLLEKQVEKYKLELKVVSNKNTLKRKLEDNDEEKTDNNKKQRAFF